MIIRDAVAADLAAMASIYDHAIVYSDAIWLDEPIGIEAFARAVTSLQATGRSVLVAVDDATEGSPAPVIVGYASLGPFRTLAGYAATTEHSIFVADGHQGRGVGQRLLDELVQRAASEQRRVMVAAIDGTNEGSIRFHERNGFAVVGRLPGVGTKHGRALDLVLMQRNLVDGTQ